MNIKKEPFFVWVPDLAAQLPSESRGCIELTWQPYQRRDQQCRLQWMDTSRDSGSGTLFLVTEPMTDEVESPPSPQWAGVKRDREQVAFICDMPEADLERFLVLS